MNWGLGGHIPVSLCPSARDHLGREFKLQEIPGPMGLAWQQPAFCWTGRPTSPPLSAPIRLRYRRSSPSWAATQAGLDLSSSPEEEQTGVWQSETPRRSGHYVAYQLVAVSASGLGGAELGQTNRARRLQEIKEDHLCLQRRPKPSPLPGHTQEP